MGNDVLRAVALLGGLIVAGALLLSTADPRVAQFRFESQGLGMVSGPGPVVSIALDARDPSVIYAGTEDPADLVSTGAIRRAATLGDLAVDGSGRVFSARMISDGIEVAHIAGEGPPQITSIPTPAGAGATAHIVAREDGLVVVSTVLGRRLRVWMSSDQARTFVEGGQIDSPVAAAGPVIVGPFGSLFAGVVTPEGLIGVAASADGGERWSARGVTTVSGVDLVPPSIAVDDAANLYVAFTTSIDGIPRVSIANTGDLSLTWSEPLSVAPPGSHSPQLVAGSLGKVGLAYLSGDELVYRYTTEALLRQPFWTEHLVSLNVVCPNPCVRAPYEVMLTRNSRAVFAARSGDSLVVAEQVSGSGVR